MPSSKHSKLILDLLICSFEDELLRQYGAIGTFMQHYPELGKEEIIESLNAHLTDPEQHMNTLLSDACQLNNEQRITLIDQCNSFINTCVRHMELPGDKNHVKHRLSQLLTKIEVRENGKD